MALTINVTMTVQRFTDNSSIPDKDKQYIINALGCAFFYFCH